MITVPIRLGLLDDPKRSAGLHLSTLISGIAVDMGFLKGNAAAREMNAFAEAKINLGLAWEDWITKHPMYSNLIYHPGEYLSSGISMSPDAIGFDENGTSILYEFKLTWKSQSRNVVDEWMWITQMKSYCRAIGTTKAVLCVFWVNGNYRYDDDSGPQFVEYRFDFKDSELEENWQMIMNYKKVWEKKNPTV